MKKYRLTIVFIGFITFLGFAQEEQFNAKIGPNEAINMEVGASVEVEDFNYFSPNSSVIDAGVEIYLGIENDIILPTPFGFKYTAVLEIETYNLTTNAITDTYNLTMDIAYSPLGSVGNLKDFMIQKLNGIQKIKVNVVSVAIEDINTGNALPNTNPGNVYLELIYKSNRQYNLTVQLPELSHRYITINSDNSESINTAPVVEADELEFLWSSIEGAEEYDLEWTWVDNYSKNPDLIVSITSYIDLSDQDFKLNSTRIKTKNTTYRIPLIYANGYVVYRIRPIAKTFYTTAENPSKRKTSVLYGKWTSEQNIKEKVSDWPHRALVYSHEGNKNWQFQASYAEEGKKKEVVSYFDGTLRNRQTVTKINSDNNAIVGEVIYDTQGRPAVEVLPVPSGLSAIRHYDRFNLNTEPEETREIYSHLDFDWDNDAQCNLVINGMHKEAGSSKYYSDNNVVQNNWQDYVPDAKNYPFSQIEYTPDNTGRISRKGGVGETHKLGTDNEMKYYYGVPSQLELNRLFGYKVGYKKHYKKNVVIDPNGQASVSYIDPQGRTIATALAGEAPLALEGLDDEKNNTLHNTIQEDLLNKVNIGDTDTDLDNNIKYSTGKYGTLNDGLNYYSQFIVTETSADYFYDYKFSNDGTFLFCGNEYSFIYDLDLSLEDVCGLDASNGGAFSGTIPGDPSYNNSFTTILSQGVYTLNKNLRVNAEALEDYIDSYVTSGDCDFSPEDFRNNANFSGCFTTCAECMTSLGTQPNYITQGLEDKALENGGPLSTDQVTAYTIILENEWQTFFDACNKPCLDEKLDFSCNINEQRLLQDFYPGEQYAITINTTTLTNEDGDVIEFNPDTNNDGFVDDKLSIYNPDFELPNISGLPVGSFVWQNPDTSIPYMDDFGNLAYVKIKVTLDENDERVYEPEINELASGEGYDTAEPDEEGYILVKPNHLIHHEDFEAEWRNSWAKSLLKYHPEQCYLDYYTELCIVEIGGVSSTGFDTYLNSLESYNEAATAGLFNTEISILEADPFFASQYTNIENFNDFEAREGIMTYALTVSYDGSLKDTGEGLKLWEMVYSYVVCGNPEIYDCTSTLPTTLSSAISNLDTDEKEAFWLRYRLFYSTVKEKIIYVFSNIYAGNNGCLNECIEQGGKIGQGFQNVIAAYEDPVDPYDASENYFSYVSSQRSGFPSGYCNSNGSLYNNKKRRFLPYDLFYDSAADVEVAAEDLVDMVDLEYWEQTGNCPMVLDLQIFLDGLFIDENNNLSSATMFNSNGLVNADYLTTDLYETLSDIEIANEPPSGSIKLTATINTDPKSIDIIVADDNDRDTNAFNGETCNITLSNDTYSFNNYGTSWRILKMDRAYYVPESFTNTGLYEFKILATVEDILTGEISEYVFHGSSCVNLATCLEEICGVGDCDLPYTLTVKNGVTSLLNKLLETGDINSLVNIPIDSYTEYTSSFIPTFFNFPSSPEYRFDVDGNFNFSLNSSSNESLLFIMNGDYSNASSFIDEFLDIRFTEVTSVSSTSPGHNIVLVYKDVNGLIVEDTGILEYKEHTLLSVCLEEPEYLMIFTLRKQTSSPQTNISDAIYKDISFYVNQGFSKHELIDMEFDISLNNGDYIDPAPSMIGSPVVDLENINVNIILNGSSYSLPSDNMFVAYESERLFSGSGNHCYDGPLLLNTLSWSGYYPGFQNISYLDYDVNGHNRIFNFDESIGAPMSSDSEVTMGRTVPWEWAGTINNPELSVVGDTGFTCNTINPYWVDPVSMKFEEGLELNFKAKLRITSDLHLIQYNPAYPNYLSPGEYFYYGNLAQLNSLEPDSDSDGIIDNDILYSLLVGTQTTSKFVNSLPSPCDCVTQTIEPVSCDEKYETFKNAIEGGLIQGYTLPDFYTKDFFCQMNYQYSVDDYLYYLNHIDFISHAEVNPKDLDKNTFMTIGEFATSPVNQGYIGMQDLIDLYVEYLTLNKTLKDLKSWHTYVEDFVEINDVGCLPKPLFTESLTLNPSDIVDTCMEFDMNLKDTYQNDLYDQYIELKKSEFREAYLAQALNNAIENFDVTHPDKEYQYTLYYYDQAGNLAQTVSPEGVYRLGDNASDGTITDIVNAVNISRDTNPDNENSLDPSGNIKILPDHKLKTKYKYNSLNQLVWQNTPDGGETRFAYDALGRIIASQNEKQLDNNDGTMSYTRYDLLGRIIEAGEMTLTSDFSISDSGYLFNTLTSTIVDEVNELDYPENLTTIARTEVTKTYYDKSILNKESLFENYDINSTRNRVTAVLYYDNYTPSITSLDAYNNAIYYNYDIHGNVDEMITEINDSKLKALDQHVKKTQYEYDLISGNVNQVTYQKGKKDQFMHRYEYDDDNRITNVYTSNDSVIWEKDANYQYYAHGPLARVLVGDKKVQGLDYAYTLQGWLKGVNNEVLNLNDIGQDANANTVAKDAYAYTLSYFNNDYTPRLSANPFSTSDTFYSTDSELMNGNIRGMTTALMDIDENNLNIISNKYNYDQLNRIVSMNSTESASTGGTPNLAGIQSTYAYDRNGNLDNLYRSARESGGSIKDMDNLSYSYYLNSDGNPTNKLKIVNDAIADGEFTDADIDNHTNDYVYDKIGQLTQDIDEGIQDINWRVDGKVSKVTKSDGQEISFTYDGLGNRLSKHNGDENKTTYYMRDAQGNVLGVYDMLDESNGSTFFDYDIFLNNQVITDTEIIQAGHNIEASDVSVEVGGDLTLEAGNQIILKPGFIANHGSDFVAKIVPTSFPSQLTYKLNEHQIYGSSRLGVQNYNDIELSGSSDLDDLYQASIENLESPVNNEKYVLAPSSSPSIVTLPLPEFNTSANKALNFDGSLEGVWEDQSVANSGYFGKYNAEIKTKINITNAPTGIGTVAQLSYLHNYSSYSLGVKRILLNIESDGTKYSPSIVVEDRYLFNETINDEERVYTRTTTYALPIANGVTDPALNIVFKVSVSGYFKYDAVLILNGISYTLSNQGLTLGVTAAITSETHQISNSRIPGENTQGMTFEMCNFSYQLSNNKQELDFSTIGSNPNVFDTNPTTVSTDYVMTLNSLDSAYWIDSSCDNTTIIYDRDNDTVYDDIDIDNDNDGILDVVEGANDIDGDGIPNYFDLDSDNDGIPDNVEAQLTSTYISSLGVDSDGNGLDDAYETTPGNGVGIIPINTDGDGAYDFMDFDSDNDTVLDVIERNSTNLGIADVVSSGTDTDQDGLDDAFEGANVNDGYINPTINPTTDYRNTDGEDDLDYRDIDDDNDNYFTYEEDTNINGILPDDDTDGDGISDYLDPDNSNPSIPEVGPIEIFSRIAGDKRYELSNHLGNVLAVVSDRKLIKNGIFTPDVLTYNDYYPFGSLLPNRHGSTDSYRYGFQGQEKDDEIKGEGNSLNYKYRMHDPRVGRFFAVDPLEKKYPWYTPYQFSGNKVIQFVEFEGLEEGLSARYGMGAYDLNSRLYAEGKITSEEYWSNINTRAAGAAVSLTVTTDVLVTKGAATRMLFKQLMVQTGVNLTVDGISSVFTDKEFDPAATVRESFTGLDLADISIDKAIKLALNKYKVGKLQMALEAVAPALFDVTYKDGVQIVGLNKDSGTLITDILGNMLTTGIEERIGNVNIPTIKSSSGEQAQVFSKSITDNIEAIADAVEDALKLVIEVRNVNVSKPTDERELNITVKDNIPEVQKQKKINE